MSTGEKRYESFDSLLEKSIALAKKIAHWSKETGNKFDGLVVIPRGGFYPAMVISRMFHLEAPAIISASLTSYPHDKKISSGTFKKGQVPLVTHVKGLSWLIVDDIFDTGKTIQEVTDDLYKQGAASVKSACMYYKPGKREVALKPDFFVEEYDGWVDFAWEKDLEGLLDLDDLQIFKDVSFVAGKTDAPA